MDIDKFITNQVKDYEKKPPRKVWMNVFLFLHYTAFASAWFFVKSVVFSKWVYIPVVAVISSVGIYYGMHQQYAVADETGKYLNTYSQLTEKTLLAVQHIKFNIDNLQDKEVQVDTEAKTENELPDNTNDASLITENATLNEVKDPLLNNESALKEKEGKDVEENKLEKNKKLDRVFLLKTTEYDEIKNIIFKNSKGAIVHKVAYSKTSNPYFSIDIATLPKGRYTIYVETATELVKHKIISIK